MSEVNLQRLNRAKTNKSAVATRSPILRSSILVKKSQQPNRINRSSLTLAQHRQINSFSPGFSFSKVSRFGSNLIEKFKNMSPLFVTSLTKSKDSAKQAIQNNKLMKFHSPFEKSIRLRTISIQESSHRESIKLKRQIILKTARKEREEKMIEKFRKFEIRQNKTEAVSSKKAWLVLFCAVSSCFVTKMAIANKKILKKRVASRIVWLRAISKYLGRMKQKLKAIRRRKSMRVSFNQVLLKYVSFFKACAARIRRTHASIIAGFCEGMADRAEFSSKMLLWKFKIISMQRSLKQALKTRRLLYTELIKEWVGFEHYLFTEKSRLNRKGKVKEAKSRIPDDVKITYIRREIREIVANYLIRVKNFSAVKCLYAEAIKNFRRQQSVILEYNPIKPEPPNLKKEFTFDVFERLIHTAIRERIQWRKSYRHVQ